MLTAIARDAEFAEAFRTRVIGPKIAALAGRSASAPATAARSAPTSTSTLIVPALAGIVLHRLFLMGEQPDAELISRVIDQIILPAATCGSANPYLPDHTRNPNEKEDS